MASILSLFILVQYKHTTRYFIHEYEIDESKLTLSYTEKGVKKTVELQRGEYQVEKKYTFLYRSSRPFREMGTKMYISWNEGTIYQYWIGDWDEDKMEALLKAKKRFH